MLLRFIRGTIENFLLSFDSVLIEREWEENNLKCKRYGKIEPWESNKVHCAGNKECLCYKCLIIKQNK